MTEVGEEIKRQSWYCKRITDAVDSMERMRTKSIILKAASDHCCKFI